MSGGSVRMFSSGYYKFGVLLICSLVAIGNFFPETPIYGFDRYVIGLPFGFKSVPSFLLILGVATYPMAAGKNMLYDNVYAAVACFIFSFLFLKWYTVLRNVLAGVDLYSAYRDLYGGTFSTNSIFFPYANRLLLLGIFCSHMLWSLRLSSFTWKEIGFIAGTAVVSVITAVDI
jgi:hypothetical protein